MANETKQDVVVSTKPAADITETSRPTPMVGALEEVERLFDRLMPHTWITPMNWNWPMWRGFDESLENIRAPQMDVIDRDKEILVRLEVPGVEKKDVNVSVSNGTLALTACGRRESKEQRKDFFRCEIAQGNFSRSVAIPAGIDQTKISASLKDGILEINLPKEEGAQRRTVEVK